MERSDKRIGFFIGNGDQRAPLGSVERRRRQHRGGNAQRIGCKIFKQGQRERQCGDGPGGGGANRLVDPRRLCADRLERFGGHRAGAVRSRARDKVDQLAPPDRGVMAVLRRLVEDGQQTIVEPHLNTRFLAPYPCPALGEHLLCAKGKRLNHPETVHADQEAPALRRLLSGRRLAQAFWAR